MCPIRITFARHDRLNLIQNTGNNMSFKIFLRINIGYQPDQASEESALLNADIYEVDHGFHQPLLQGRYRFENFSRLGRNYFLRGDLLFSAWHHTSFCKQTPSHSAGSLLSADCRLRLTICCKSRSVHFRKYSHLIQFLAEPPPLLLSFRQYPLRAVGHSLTRHRFFPIQFSLSQIAFQLFHCRRLRLSFCHRNPSFPPILGIRKGPCSSHDPFKSVFSFLFYKFTINQNCLYDLPYL